MKACIQRVSIKMAISGSSPLKGNERLMDEVENGHGLYHKEEMPPLLDRAAIGPALHRQESTSCSKYIGWLLLI